MTKFLNYIFLLFLLTPCFGQIQLGNGFDTDSLILDSLTSNFNRSAITEHQKVYLHLDRPNYYSGETIWFKAYLVKARTNQLDYRSGVLTVELIAQDGKVLNSDQFKLSAGHASGSISLGDTLKTGLYVVRAYTNWMRNFDPRFYATKPIEITQISVDENNLDLPIKSNSDSILLKFYPEGGYLLRGVPNQVGFKATDMAGRSVEIEGYCF